VFRRLLTLTAFGLSTVALPAQAANDLDRLDLLVQSEFRLLSEDLAGALSYQAVIPAEPLGITGFDLGVVVTTVRLENAAVFDQAMSSGSPARLVFPKLHLHKGLPFDFDVGAFVAGVPDSNIRLWGAELRYAILKGGVTSPALAVRASYSALDGVDQLKYNTTGLDVSISKGFAFLTPYAGVGHVWVHSTPVDVAGLQPEEFSVNKYFIGLNANFAVVNLALEGDKVGDTTSYGVKFGWRF
jgi:hypothetical protein